MTRGKYAAKAANRMARLDNELVRELQEELTAIKHERDEARRDMEQLRRDVEAEARRIGANLAGVEILELRQQLKDEQEQRVTDRERYCERVFDLLRPKGLPLDLDAWTDLATIFGQGHRVGLLILGGRGNRTGRRANAAYTRVLGELVDRGVVK